MSPEMTRSLQQTDDFEGIDKVLTQWAGSFSKTDFAPMVFRRSGRTNGLSGVSLQNIKVHLKDDEQPTLHKRIGDRRHTLPIEHEDVVMLGHL